MDAVNIDKKTGRVDSAFITFGFVVEEKRQGYTVMVLICCLKSFHYE